MNYFDIILLALALSVDAFIVSFSYGLIIKKGKGKSALKLAFATGFGQFIMPVLGWYGAKSIYKHIEMMDHWIAFFVFLVLGVKIISDAFRGCDCPSKLSKVLTIRILLFVGLATSIDALVSGSMLYFMQAPVWQASAIIGIITFINSVLGFNFCRIFKKFPTKYMEVISGVILIILGCKVLYEHLS